MVRQPDPARKTYRRCPRHLRFQRTIHHKLETLTRTDIARCRGGLRLLGLVFGVDAAFDGVTPDDDVLLGEGQWDSSGDFEPELDQVDAGDHVGDGMFHLYAGVHLDDVLLALDVVEDKLDGTRIA